MIIWFLYWITLFFFCCDKFNVSMFSHIFHSFFKKGINHQLKKIFFKILFSLFFLRSVFISIYSFNQAFWLNLITLWTFFKTNPWFNVCFKFLMWITHSVLSWKIATSFSNCIYLVKMVNHYEVHVIFQDVNF